MKLNWMGEDWLLNHQFPKKKLKESKIKPHLISNKRKFKKIKEIWIWLKKDFLTKITGFIKSQRWARLNLNWDKDFGSLKIKHWRPHPIFSSQPPDCKLEICQEENSLRKKWKNWWNMLPMNGHRHYHQRLRKLCIKAKRQLPTLRSWKMVKRPIPKPEML